jgi:mono/diheme cytochrome c family protein
MRSRAAWTIFALVMAAIIVIAILFLRFSLSAVAGPGPLETRMANRAKHFFISRASRETVLPALPDNKAAIAEGDTLYGIDCGMCHGRDGHAKTDMGRWMYPRAVDLTSAEAQSYSDRELFWTIKNGIRFSGMPAFGKVESDEHIRDLVAFIRTLPANSSK